MLTTTLQDQVNALDVLVYTGNSLTVTITVTGSEPMPNQVSIKGYYSAGGELLEEALQPQVFVSGRIITVTYPASTGIEFKGYQQVRFDGRTVMAGIYQVSRETINLPAITNIPVSLGGSVNVNLTILPGGKSPNEMNFRLDAIEPGHQIIHNQNTTFVEGKFYPDDSASNDELWMIEADGPNAITIESTDSISFTGELFVTFHHKTNA